GAAQAYVTLAELTQVGSDTDWADVELDRENGCAIKKDGSLYCWGHDDVGETGQAKPAADTLTETPSHLGTATNWKQLSMAYGAALAVDATGALWCWGTNTSGQCGQGMGAAMSFNVPTRVGTDSDWAQVNSNITTCAVKTDGTLWCWGIVGMAVQNTPT